MEAKRAMSSGLMEIDVPVEETEAYLELMTRAGRRTGDVPADLVVRHVLGVRAALTSGRRGSRRSTRCCAGWRRPARTACASRRGRRKAGISGCMSPGGRERARGLIARSCTESTRSRAGAIAPISSRTRWACASTSWWCSITSTLVRASCNRHSRNRSGATLESARGLCWDPIRPLLGLGDWLDRVVWKGDVEPAKARSARVAQALKWFRASKDGVATLEEQLPRQAGPAARAGRRPAQGHAGRRRKWVSP